MRSHKKPGARAWRATGQRKDRRQDIAKRIVRYYGLFRKQMAIFIVVTAFSTVLGVLGPAVLGLVTTKIFTGIMAMADGTAKTLDYVGIGQIGAILICMYAAMYVCQYLQGRMMTRITNRTTYNIRKDVSKKLNRLPLLWLSTASHGQAISAVINDADVLGVTLGQVTTQLFNSAFTIIGVAVIMLFMDLQLALLVLCMVPLAWAVSKVLSRASGRHYDAHQAHISDLTSHADRHMAALGMAQATGCAQASRDAFGATNARLCNAAFRAQAAAGVFLPVMSAATNFTYAGVCALGARLVLLGSITIGELQAFIQYIRSFFASLVQLATLRTSLEHLVAAAGHVFDFLDLPEQPEWRGRQDADDVHGAMSVGVAHGYSQDGRDLLLLNRVCFDVPAGSRVVLTGPEGAGKSLLMPILGGAEPNREGCVTLDGMPTWGFRPGALAAVVRSAPQLPWLEVESVEDNIRYGRPDATHEQVVEAARRAGADAFIRTLPDGYDTTVAEMGANLSAGQKQLVQLARAFLGNPRIILLDDALGELDALTRRDVLEALARTGATQVIVSKLADVAASADQIVMMEHGMVVQSGPPGKMFSEPGPFRSFMDGGA